jgi:glucans biosynthesis protein
MLYRNAFLFAAGLGAICCAPLMLRAEATFNFAALKQQAQTLASAPHVPPKRVTEPFLKLDYDGYRLIAAERNNALWRDGQLPFWTEFFPAGFIFEYPVEVNTVDKAGHVERLSPSDKWFQFRNASQSLAKEPGLGFSGFRLLARLAPNTEMDEFVVFQGASYFRGRVAPHGYGASVRALAIDTGLTSPEEFPRFREFWLERPEKDATSVRLWALIDSPAEAGACQFIITPGSRLTIDVETEVWFRHHVQKVGIAPITSMWMWDNVNAAGGDPRPEVHDSDGLLIYSADGDWTWRSLQRPSKPQVSRWPMTNVAGFGLLQRDRDASHYRDAEAKYQDRPSVWITPAEEWKNGHIELLELPAPHEGMDNIGAYWVDDRPIDAGSHLSLRYRVTFGDEPSQPQPEWRVVDSRVPVSNESHTFEIEFGKLDPPMSTAMLKPRVTCDGGTIENIQMMAQADGRLLVRFACRPTGDKPAHIQAQLRSETGPVSENWSYQWTRQ